MKTCVLGLLVFGASILVAACDSTSSRVVATATPTTTPAPPFPVPPAPLTLSNKEVLSELNKSCGGDQFFDEDRRWYCNRLQRLLEERVEPPARDTPARTCDYAGTAEPLIKGNVAFDTGEHIYHVPGGAFYLATQIDPRYGELWFCTEVEARQAGWRRSAQ